MNRHRHPARTIAAAISGSLIVGCASTSRLQGPALHFQESIDAAGATIADYYGEVNRFEREVYLHEREMDRLLEVDEIDSLGLPTPLVARFSPASIQTRLEALSVLGVYAQRLSELAGSGAPVRFEEAADALGFELDTLIDRMQSLAGAGGDHAAAGYIGPVTTLAGVVGGMIMTAKRERALEEAVGAGAPAVNALLDHLERDLRDFSELRSTGLRQMLASRVIEYNENVRALVESGGGWSDGQRRQALDRIDDLAERLATEPLVTPVGLVEGMRRSHQALVSYAECPRRCRAELATVVAALEDFRARIDRVAGALDRLRSRADDHDTNQGGGP